jgi:hypothetical protein
MTIDDRIQAFTQTLELLASLHEDTERKLAAVHEQTERELRSLAESVKAHDGHFAEHEKYLMQITEGTARLLHVAESHERRLSRLEGLPEES